MEWINVWEQAPEDGQIVLTYFEFCGIEIMEYRDMSKTEFAEHGTHQFGNRTGFLTDDVEWWMPLPDIPKEE